MMQTLAPLTATELLLTEALADRRADATVVFGSSALAAALVKAGPLHLHTTGVIDHVQALPIAGVTVTEGVALDQAQYGSFDCVVIAAPQSRVLARRWLCEALAALKPGGVLYLAGANDLGIRSLIDDAAALFEHTHTLLAKRHARVARAVRPATPPSPDWAMLPGIAPGSWAQIAQATAGGVQYWSSLPGIFSYDRIDPATTLLLDHLGSVAGQRVLDLGCGYGIIGLTAAQQGAANSDLVDDDRYAVAAAQRNSTHFGLTNVQVVAADVASAPLAGPYDLVLTNPPFHRGKAVDYSAAHSFIAFARRVLAPQGRFLLVANRFIRYDTVLAKEFAHVEQVAFTPSFTLWQAQQRQPPMNADERS